MKPCRDGARIAVHLVDVNSVYSAVRRELEEG